MEGVRFIGSPLNGGFTVLPPSLFTCHMTNFNVASCSNMLRKVHPSSTFRSKLLLLSLASQLAMHHNACDWSIFSCTKSAGKVVCKCALDLGQIIKTSSGGQEL